MFTVSVTIRVKPAHLQDFIAASRDNHLGTRQEPGNRRFDVIQGNADPSHFALYEVYDDQAAFTAHQQTAHYARWKAAVEPWMAVPRTAEKGTLLFPSPYA